MKRPARLLDVGNCDPDHGAIRRMLVSAFDVRIDRVMFVHEAMIRLRESAYDLVLVNRLIFEDGSPGLDLLRRMREDALLSPIPVMMISNFEDAQQVAVSEGARRGFGKSSLGSAETLKRLSEFLPPREG